MEGNQGNKKERMKEGGNGEQSKVWKQDWVTKDKSKKKKGNKNQG